MRLEWLPTGDLDDFIESCSLGVRRWRTWAMFRKWRKENPRWRNDLVEMKKGEAGEATFHLERLDRGKSLNAPQYNLHLVLSWKERSGGEGVAAFTLSTAENE